MIAVQVQIANWVCLHVGAALCIDSATLPSND